MGIQLAPDSQSSSATPGSTAEAHPLYRFGAFQFDPASGDLTTSDTTTRLQPLRARLLVHFAEHAGEVLSRECLYELLWPAGYVEQDLGLNAAIRGLRRALGDDATNPTYIETLRRRGYRFLPKVHRMAPREPESASTPERSKHRWKGTGGTMFFVGALAALLVLVAAIYGPSRGSADLPAEAAEPRLAQLRHLVDAGDSASLSRADVLLAQLPEDLRGGAEALGLRARMAYQRNDVQTARTLARRGATMDEPSPEALRLLGDILLYQDWDAPAAAATLSQAVERHPSPRNLQSLAFALIALGDLEGANHAIRRAVELGPVDVALSTDASIVAYMARDFGTARSWCADAELLTGRTAATLRCHLTVAINLGDLEAADQYAREALELNAGPDAVPQADAELGQATTAYWEWQLDQSLEAQGFTAAQASFARARALAHLGRIDEALDQLNQAVEGRAPAALFAAHLPYFDVLRQTERFKTIAKAVHPIETDAVD